MMQKLESVQTEVQYNRTERKILEESKTGSHGSSST